MDEEGGSAHNKTITKSIPMDLTLGMESVGSDANLDTTSTIQVRNLPHPTSSVYMYFHQERREKGLVN